MDEPMTLSEEIGKSISAGNWWLAPWRDRAAELEAESAIAIANISDLEDDPDRCSICGGYDPNGTHYACDAEAIAKRNRGDGE